MKRRPSEFVILTLGLGMGIDHMPREELKEMQREYGDQVRDIWKERTGHEETFVDCVARYEGWDKK